MDSRNVQTLRSAHESWNKRDFAGVIRNAADKIVYTDQAQTRTMNGRDNLRQWVEEWAKAFPDGKITKPEYIDAGEVVVARFIVEGTNTGPFGSLKASGRRVSLPFCEIARFDQQGKLLTGSCYYDQYTLLTQLGHVQPLMAAA